MNTLFCRLAIAGVVSAIGAACQSTPPAVLFDELPGRVSQETAREILAQRSSTWEVLGRRTEPARGGSPATEAELVNVGDYQHLGVKGTLKLHFYNHKLRAAWFCAGARQGEYVGNLQRQLGVSLSKDQAAHHGGVLIRLGSQTEGLDCVCYEDPGLTEEMKNWAFRHS